MFSLALCLRGTSSFSLSLASMQQRIHKRDVPVERVEVEEHIKRCLALLCCMCLIPQRSAKETLKKL